MPLLPALSSNNWPNSLSTCFCFVDVDDKATFWLLVEGDETNDTFSVFRSMSCPVESNFHLDLAPEFGLMLNSTNFFETGWNGVERKTCSSIVANKVVIRR